MNTRNTRRLARLCFLLLASAALSGCLLTSPYHNQVLSSRTQAIPFQAWSVESGGTMRIECMKTNRFGPEITSYGPWQAAGNLPISADASRDLDGVKAYSASRELALPESCWYLNRNNGWYYTSLRVIQTDYLNRPEAAFFTLDRDGVTCAGEAVGDRGSWLAWSSAGCHQKYSNGDSLHWITLRTES